MMKNNSANKTNNGANDKNNSVSNDNGDSSKKQPTTAGLSKRLSFRVPVEATKWFDCNKDSSFKAFSDTSLFWVVTLGASQILWETSFCLQGCRTNSVWRPICCVDHLTQTIHDDPPIHSKKMRFQHS